MTHISVEEILPTVGLLELDLAIMSRQGGRSYNEDACGHWNSEHQLCCVVADGAGGHGGGDIASKLAVQYLLQACAQQETTSVSQMQQMLYDTNCYIRSQQVPGTIQENMHTTVVTMCLDLHTQSVVWGHVGDSRLYVFRSGLLRTRTRDHSLVQSMLDAGMLKQEDMRHHAKRSELLCALGSQKSDLLVSVSADPLRVAPGDVFLLCTDGLWEYIEDAEFEWLLHTAPDPRAWLASLEATVLRNALQKPRHDNFSALTVWVKQAT